MLHIRSLIVPALAAALLLTGCGGDDETPAKAPAVGTTAPGAIAPVTATEAAGGKLTVDATEFRFDPPAINAKAGKVKLTLNNTGRTTHELVVLKTDQAADSLKVSRGRVSEAASVGEISETTKGRTRSHTFDLEPGKYVYVCNLPAHYSAGMFGTLTVK